MCTATWVNHLIVNLSKLAKRKSRHNDLWITTQMNWHSPKCSNGTAQRR